MISADWGIALFIHSSFSLGVYRIADRFRIPFTGYPVEYPVSDAFYVKSFIIYENTEFVTVNI